MASTRVPDTRPRNAENHASVRRSASLISDLLFLSSCRLATIRGHTCFSALGVRREGALRWLLAGDVNVLPTYPTYALGKLVEKSDITDDLGFGYC